MKQKCLILASYMEFVDSELAQTAALDMDYIIAADGGQNYARAFGLQPDCVIGDFDSTLQNEQFDCLYITYPPEKDLTDMEACLQHAMEAGYRDITVLGGIGGRLDHTLGNISLLLEFAPKLQHFRFLDGKNTMQLLENDTITLPLDPRYHYFSLISMSEVSHKVSIEGAKYNLENADLFQSTTRAISNEFQEDHVRISVEDGRLLIVRSSDFGKHLTDA